MAVRVQRLFEHNDPLMIATRLVLACMLSWDLVGIMFLVNLTSGR